MKYARVDTSGAHRFQIGHFVRLNKSPNISQAAEDAYEILAQLPESNGVFQYRIKSVREAYQRIAKESELEPKLSERTVFRNEA